MLFPELVSEGIEKAAKRRVNYYWEDLTDGYPVLEVFVRGKLEEVKNIPLFVSQRLVEGEGIGEDKAEVVLDQVGIDYYSVSVVIDPSILSNDELEDIIGVLGMYGESEYKA